MESFQELGFLVYFSESSRIGFAPVFPKRVETYAAVQRLYRLWGKPCLNGKNRSWTACPSGIFLLARRKRGPRREFGARRPKFLHRHG